MKYAILLLTGVIFLTASSADAQSGPSSRSWTIRFVPVPELETALATIVVSEVTLKAGPDNRLEASGNDDALMRVEHLIRSLDLPTPLELEIRVTLETKEVVILWTSTLTSKPAPSTSKATRSRTPTTSSRPTCTASSSHRTGVSSAGSHPTARRGMASSR